MQAENNKYYYYHTFAPYHSSINILFNDGTNQTVDIKGVNKSTFYKLNATSGKKIAVSTETTIIPTAIDDVPEPTMTCKVYPNPCTDYLYIATPHAVNHVVLYDLEGQMLMCGNDACIDVRYLSSGIYFYQIELVDGSVARGKFIKR